MSLGKYIHRVSEKISERAQGVFKHNPLIFSTLPAWIKRKSFKNEQELAAAMEGNVATLTRLVQESTKERDTLKKQLDDVRAAPVVDPRLLDTDPATYRKYLR